MFVLRLKREERKEREGEPEGYPSGAPARGGQMKLRRQAEALDLTSGTFTLILLPS